VRRRPRRRAAASGVGRAEARRREPDAADQSRRVRSRSVTARTTTVVLDGLAFPEGPRWHDGRLWFSDQHDKRVVAMQVDGAEELAFPNGSVITADESTLLVGESMASRISAFDIAPDGSLGKRRVWAQLKGATVDGICLDAEGAIWAACPFTGRVLRVLEGGEVVDEVTGTHPGAFACMLGGDDRRTLYLCT